ncbi:hypothetical protein PpBr36_08238 [Pyricularia pennisetigena]|uniref:hypothetical protein n=1 Tax=Pyricularia pennisetigena TaxID=1578925 RepID=UPI0011549A6E|nr:hypothetical protein PpBr36_08238 [Pyricularia pennisetigena]TLS24206.1 hypothetical protein PpBr36_08238 [Pyricularia pennisetigena]
MPAQQSQPPLALPPTLSPETLDALTELAAIVSRLRPPQSLPGGITVNTPGAAATPAAGIGIGGPSGATISIKDVPNATDAVKHKLQRARAQVKALPDMSRTLEEQRETIALLEETLRQQQEVLAALRSVDGAHGLDAADEGGDKMDM